MNLLGTCALLGLVAVLKIMLVRVSYRAALPPQSRCVSR